MTVLEKARYGSPDTWQTVARDTVDYTPGPARVEQSARVATEAYTQVMGEVASTYVNFLTYPLRTYASATQAIKEYTDRIYAAPDTPETPRFPTEKYGTVLEVTKENGEREHIGIRRLTKDDEDTMRAHFAGLSDEDLGTRMFRVVNDSNRALVIEECLRTTSLYHDDHVDFVAENEAGEIVASAGYSTGANGATDPIAATWEGYRHSQTDEHASLSRVLYAQMIDAAVEDPRTREITTEIIATNDAMRKLHCGTLEAHPQIGAIARELDCGYYTFTAPVVK